MSQTASQLKDLGFLPSEIQDRICCQIGKILPLKPLPSEIVVYRLPKTKEVPPTYPHTPKMTRKVILTFTYDTQTEHIVASGLRELIRVEDKMELIYADEAGYPKEQAYHQQCVVDLNLHGDDLLWVVVQW
ncbi:MAG: hypothetical protein WC400_02610 [Patescibacteria group bacterium]|jgi:hypothetical protein